MCQVCNLTEEDYEWNIGTAASKFKTHVFPKRHVTNYFDLTGQEREDIDRILYQIKYSLEWKSEKIKRQIKSFDVGFTSNIENHLIVTVRAIYVTE